ncbi:hypothetical protein LJB89_04745, partial [Tyzzerella sp. OttesenSCG-928-J15]|nr:hypothetical protein [Tyzzerella sp. OttesenSCG-928-J15]
MMTNIRKREPLTKELADSIGVSDEWYNSIKILESYIESTGKTQAVVAKELNVSDAAISSFLAGNYKTPHTIIRKVNQLIKISDKRSASPTEPSFKMTSISQQVTNIITYCHLQGKIGVAYGDAGIGKTMAIKQYIKENPEAIMITISPCF